MSAHILDIDHPVVYLCAEFGFDAQIPIYAGGLGILAGDTIKQAADQNLPFIGVGLLYRGQNMATSLQEDGWQIESDWQYDPVSVGLEHVFSPSGQPLFITVQLGQEIVWLRCWKKSFAPHTTLYLLDSDTDQNPTHLRNLTQHLYTGDQDYQVKQQVLHGVGSVNLIQALSIDPYIYHLNEGRPVFAHWQLILNTMKIHQVAAESALRLVKNKIVYTNHTLVAAGNMSYPMRVLEPLAEPFASQMNISTSQLLSLGSTNNPDQFSITTAALNVSRKANGVSAIHSRLSKQSWPDYTWVNITNGVHAPSWQNTQIKENVNDPALLWNSHLEAKKELQKLVLEYTGFTYDPDRLVISWARRIAGYKQLNKLFDDVERLFRILSNLDKPVQLLVSGKAHFGDTHAKDLLKEVINHFKTTLAGHALFIPNYNITVGKYLTSGSDVWLNTPVHGMEASGTSGMKAIANGVLQATVADGWAAEVDWSNKGWTIDPNSTSESLYELLEREIVPLYYDRNDKGLPLGWIQHMQESIKLYPDFSTKRMMDEYISLLYSE